VASHEQSLEMETRGIGMPTAGRQDKKPHRAALTVDCFIWVISDFLHGALCDRTVRSFIFDNNFNKNRTVQGQPR
jgi:hypothetical protein